MSLDFIMKLKSGWSGDCPCCNRFAKVYHRSIHVSIALQLIQLYKLGGYGGKFIHASKLIPKGNTGTGDFNKAKYWGLIEELPESTMPHQKSNGHWQLTPMGIEFVLGNMLVNKYAVIYNDRVIDVTGALVSIKDCLKEKFNYSDLMDGGTL